MKLHERLCLRSHFWSLADKIEGVEIANTINPKAWAAFLRGASAEEIEPLLEKVQSGRSRPAKLVLALIRAGLSRDAAAFQKALVKWLEHYRREEFPKEKMTKKITVEGTFFVHWAEKEGLPVMVPPEFTDHIVRLG